MCDRELRVLFISRAFPPVTGGIENQNGELSRWLPRHARVRTIANRRGRKFLPIFVPLTFVRALFALRRHDVLLLGDGVLAVLGWALKLFSRKPVVCVVHGLDITYARRNLGLPLEGALAWLYQRFWVGVFLRKLDRYIAVGNETIRVGVEAGLERGKFTFIPNGVDTARFDPRHPRQELERVLGRPLEGRRVLLTSGRLARRKGVAWFVREVLPELPPEVLYVVAGDGPDRENIDRAVEETGAAERVLRLGYVNDDARDVLMGTADVFVQPNIPIAGDIEGFGISVIEAGACRLPVVASRLEGLRDAIAHEENGLLVEPEDAAEFARAIRRLLADEEQRSRLGERARTHVAEHYEWHAIARRYVEELEAVCRAWAREVAREDAREETREDTRS